MSDLRLKIPMPGLASVPRNRTLFGIWCLIAFGTVGLAVALEDLRLLAIIPAALGALMAAVNFRAVYFVMWACIPISTELEFSGGLAMDFPVEILLMSLTGIGILWFAQRLGTISLDMILHPISLFLILHFGWILCSTITSSDHILSVKFLLAKIWYIIPFFCLSFLVLRNEKNVRTWFLCLLLPLVLTIIFIIGRHALEGFSFESVNSILKPFYRNHVDYGLILGVSFPFIALLSFRWFPRYIAIGLTGLILVAIYLTYTRTAYIGLLVAAGGLLILRWKLVKYALLVATIGIAAIVATLSQNNRYIDFAPDYYKTITHQDFGNLLEATYKLQDISTMERFYRWIAAFYMTSEKPLLGFGANNFVGFYKSYTDEHFVTYVSDNPEQSGVHNYFLMTAVEQGIPGLIIFVLLLFIAVMRAEWLYHRLKPGFNKTLLSAVIGSLFFILFALLLNDMIETDKVGSFFFLCLALLVIIERNAKSADEWIGSSPSTPATNRASVHGR